MWCFGTGSYNPKPLCALDRTTNKFAQQKAMQNKHFTDHELAAKWMMKCSMFRTVVERYPETATARYLTAHCDNLLDH